MGLFDKEKPTASIESVKSVQNTPKEEYQPIDLSGLVSKEEYKNLKLKINAANTEILDLYFALLERFDDLEQRIVLFNTRSSQKI